jgi:hypothetical protein
MLIVAATLIAAVAIANAAGDGGSRAPRSDSSIAFGSTLRMSGDVDGLYPGADLPVPVRIDNVRTRPVRVRSIRVEVGDAAPDCRSGYLRVRSGRGRVRVPARSTRRVRLRARMSPRATDACQGRSFPLTFRARAEVLP